MRASVDYATPSVAVAESIEKALCSGTRSSSNREIADAVRLLRLLGFGGEGHEKEAEDQADDHDCPSGLDTRALAVDTEITAPSHRHLIRLTCRVDRRCGESEAPPVDVRVDRRARPSHQFDITRYAASRRPSTPTAADKVTANARL